MHLLIGQKNQLRQYISIIEAAKQLGISRVAMFKKIKKGQVMAKKIGRSYAIKKTDIEEYGK